MGRLSASGTGLAFLTNASSHASVSASMCRIDSRARYPCDSFGSITSRAVPPRPLTAANMRSLWIGNVPLLLSSSPWMISSASLIFSA
jgi:hypothetical protein